MLSTSRLAVRAFACAVVTSFLSVSAHGAFLSSMGISDNSTANAIGESQISIEVTLAGFDPVTGDTLVEFTFDVTGPDQMAITQVYFDGGFLSEIEELQPQTSGVHYAVDRGPPVLPGGKPWGFNASDGLRAGAKPPTRHNGIDPGESLSVVVSLMEGYSFADAIAALTDGTLQVGMHVQAFEDGSSASFINRPLPTPGAASLMLIGGLLCAGRRRR